MLAACGVLLGGIGFAQAQIIADKSAPANQQAAVLKHSSGAPLVNIQTPTAKGLSHNRYTQFDVDNKGAVLNNSRTANPNLAKGSAKVILNEIRSTSPSKLAGIISVEGSRADVIIANPAGIQVNGGGFKNANRAVLTTGAPVIKEGALHQLDIRQGTVAIGAGGLNDAGSAGTGYTEILSRAATVQGKIQANQLTIATGAQKIDYASGEISSGSAAGTKPALAIDTAALGSMYAGSITLIANEKGLGVKNAGTLQAERQLVLTSAGKIENSGQIRTTSAATEAAPTYLSLTTTDQAANSGNGDIDSTAGKIESKGLMVVDAGRDLVLSNTALNQSNVQTASAIILDAGRHIQINKKAALTNSGSGAISAAAGGNITINDAKLGSSGQIYTAAKAATTCKTTAPSAPSKTSASWPTATCNSMPAIWPAAQAASTLKPPSLPHLPPTRRPPMRISAAAASAPPKTSWRWPITTSAPPPPSKPPKPFTCMPVKTLISPWAQSCPPPRKT